MARNEDRMNVYCPSYLKKRLEKELPPDVTASSIAVEAWVMYLDTRKAERAALTKRDEAS